LTLTGDELVDYKEYIFDTDPNNFDSDGDGFGDGIEIKTGHNPLGR